MDHGCRYIEFTAELTLKGKRLRNHMIRMADVMDQEFCGFLSFMEPNYSSYNFNISTSQAGDYECQLNNATHQGHEHEMEENPDYLYRGVKVK